MNTNITTHAAVCSCGETEHHIIARRKTADGIGVCVWSDGLVTGYLGMVLPGVTCVRPRTVEAVNRERRAAWMLAEWVCLYDVAEVGALYSDCRKAARRGITLAEAQSATRDRSGLIPAWEVCRTDRDGSPTERVWRPPRLRWPGLVVWDYCDKAGSSGGRYELMNVDRDNVCTRTGFRFSNLSQLEAHLSERRAAS